jgi:hypothetical protein
MICRLCSNKLQYKNDDIHHPSIVELLPLFEKEILRSKEYTNFADKSKRSITKDFITLLNFAQVKEEKELRKRLNVKVFLCL